jgi:uncharacterized protein
MSEFRFSVSQLLQEPTGATRHYELDDGQFSVDETLRIQPVKGQVRLTRTPKGVLADVKVRGNAELECSRCLRRFDQPLEIAFSEEFFQTVVVNTGARLPPPDEDDAFLIDETHRLDLADALREYALLELPTAPRCDAACKGLCPVCGKNWNEGPCDCQPEQFDERLAGLSKLLDNTDS